jgi:hypothetical protein
MELEAVLPRLGYQSSTVEPVNGLRATMAGSSVLTTRGMPRSAN